MIILFPLLCAKSFARSESDLRNLLKHDCGSCHGLTLRGGLGLPLTSERVRQLPESYLFEVIRNGKAQTAMPPWNKILNDEEIRIIIRFLKEGPR